VRDLVAAVVGNPAGAHWETWLTLLSRAVADESAWMDAVAALGLDEQFILLELLRADPDVFGDALLIITARNAAAIADEEVRAFLLSDASGACQRFGARLDADRAELQDLIATSAQRRQPDFDVAADIARLQAELFELRESEIGEKFESMQRLDRDIHRLETFKKTLDRYDPDARRAYRDQLDEQTAALDAGRAELENAVAEAIGRRDTRQREHDEGARELDALTGEHDDLAAHITAQRARLDAVTQELERLHRERTELSGRVATVERQLRDEQRQVVAETRRLEELRTSPTAATNTQLQDKLGEIFALLPADDAESLFGS
jgi:chromosome segregation ATPase